MPSSELEEVWDEHCRAEFAAHDIEATMATMVAEPYVVHLPTLIGGQGGDGVRRFYVEEFLPNNPADIALEPISRTVGSQRIVDEMIVTMTHDREVPWILPGLEGTGTRIEVPLVGVITFEGGLIANEHLWWDQASVLVQLGLIPTAGLPVHGAEIASRLRTLSGLTLATPTD